MVWQVFIKTSSFATDAVVFAVDGGQHIGVCNNRTCTVTRFWKSTPTFKATDVTGPTVCIRLRRTANAFQEGTGSKKRADQLTSRWIELFTSSILKLTNRATMSAHALIASCWTSDILA